MFKSKPECSETLDTSNAFYHSGTSTFTRYEITRAIYYHGLKYHCSRLSSVLSQTNLQDANFQAETYDPYYRTLQTWILHPGNSLVCEIAAKYFRLSLAEVKAAKTLEDIKKLLKWIPYIQLEKHMASQGKEFADGPANPSAGIPTREQFDIDVAKQADLLKEEKERRAHQTKDILDEGVAPIYTPLASLAELSERLGATNTIELSPLEPEVITLDEDTLPPPEALPATSYDPSLLPTPTETTE